VGVLVNSKRTAVVGVGASECLAAGRLTAAVWEPPGSLIGSPLNTTRPVGTGSSVATHFTGVAW
jgi:hypothetical protein